MGLETFFLPVFVGGKLMHKDISAYTLLCLMVI